MAKAIDDDPSSFEDRINPFAARVAEALVEFPGDRYLLDLSAEIDVSRLKKGVDQVNWPALLEDFDRWLYETRKTSLAGKPSRGKDSFADKAEKFTDPEFASSKHWGDYSTSDEDIEMLESLRLLSKGSRESQIVRYPYDLKEIWPRAYKVLSETSAKHGFSFLPDKDVSMIKNGFVAAAALASDKDAVSAYIEGKKADECAALSTLLSVVYFLRLQPTEWLAKSTQYALPACYALHFLIKGDTEEDQELIKKSLKHPDGGRSLIGVRIGSMFKTGSSAPNLLLSSVDKLYRAIAKGYTVTEEDEFKLVLDTCFTSKTGIVRSFYRHVTRKENKMVEEIKPNGRKVSTRKEVIVRGLEAPKLHLGNEFLKEEEISTLKAFETSFPEEVTILSDEIAKRSQSKDFLLPSKVARIIVESAYAISDRISKTIKRRKEETRIRALAATTDKKITQLNWVSERNIVVRNSTPLDEDIYACIESFRADVTKRVDSLVASSL